MKLDLGTQEFHAKQVYNLQPNYFQCCNVNSYSVKISLFLCQGFVSSAQEFALYTCFDDSHLNYFRFFV